jgi:hypothetical protein
MKKSKNEKYICTDEEFEKFLNVIFDFFHYYTVKDVLLALLKNDTYLLDEMTTCAGDLEEKIDGLVLEYSNATSDKEREKIFNSIKSPKFPCDEVDL